MNPCFVEFAIASEEQLRQLEAVVTALCTAKRANLFPLDRDPFLLFELRGLSRESLHKELAKSPLGQALSAELQLAQRPPQATSSYYTRPVTVPLQSN